MRDMIKVTVIATGFGRTEAAVEAKVAQVSNQILNPMMMGGRGNAGHTPHYAGVKMSGAASLPSFPPRSHPVSERAPRQAPQQVAAPPPSRRPPSNAPSADFRDDEWDLPAFLRKSGHHEG